MIPEAYTLRLTRAVLIGGEVVDADGQPVAGAWVGFGAALNSVDEAHPELHVDVGIGTQTDSRGRWTLNRIAPEVWRRVEGAAMHPEFLSSARVSIATDPEAEKQLLAGTYVFRLGRAARLAGRVSDPEGQPVPQAAIQVSPMLAVSTPRSGFGTGSIGVMRISTNEVDGSFLVTGCLPGSNTVRIEAEGFVPTNFVVELNYNSVPFNITIQPGKRVRLRVVNQGGLPIVGAEVEFKATTAEVFGRAKTDAEGGLEWNGAPDSKLTASIRAPGYAAVEDHPVSADNEQHVVTLAALPSGLTLWGSVRDAESGQPIRHFRIVPGRPQRYFNVTNIQWSVASAPWTRSELGRFRQAIPETAGTQNGLVFKFEAEGHAPFVTRIVKSDEGEVEFNIALRPANSVTVTVLQPDGQPAVGADVGLVYPGARLRLIPGGIAHDPASGSRPFTTDDHGQFSLPPDDMIGRVVAATTGGYRESTREQLMSDPTLRLEPWGRIEGTLLSGGRGAPKRMVQFRYGRKDGAVISSAVLNTFSSDYFAYRTETDEEGHFVFPRVPSGKHTVAQFIADRPNTRDAPMEDAEIRPGETTTVNIGVSNYVVTARIRWPANLQRETDWQVSALLSTPFPARPAETRNNPQALAAWRARPEIQSATANTRQYQLTENPENVFTTENVAPGEYTLNVFVVGSGTAGGRPNKARAQVPVTVPAGPIGGTLDIGEIELQPLP